MITVTNGFQMNIERFKMCSLNTFHVSDPLKYGRNKLDFLVEFSKM